ncbi:NAD(P)/FAD-dependent oxidoreductase [Streptomyces desertarenae]|uniref:NAD(P)/FAD-dependent oxidoreductase n=1 Tax=Streptomyces desertarenae TaxID=2666184 RepID=A0ABW4PK84_9ACTN
MSEAASGTSTADVVVVGAGIIGAAVFHELADRGLRVTAVDTRRAGSGTTAWCGGVVRCYHDTPSLTDRAVAGWRYFHDFVRHTGVDVPFHTCGFLYVPRADRVEYARAETSRIAAAEVPAEWLPPAEVTRRFGHLLRGECHGAVWEPRSGYLDADRVTRGYLRAGQRKGGRLMEGVEVRGLLRSGERVTGVRTGPGAVHAGTVVLATGAWTPALLSSWGIPHDMWIQAIQVDLRFPSTPLTGHPAYMDDLYDLNGRPDPDSAGVYVGHPTGLRLQDADRHEPADPAHSQSIRKAAGQRLRWMDDSHAGGGLRAPECHAPGTAARVGPLSRDSSLLLATGFNGGGFKMAPWAAAEVADLVTEAAAAPSTSSVPSRDTERRSAR